MHSATAPASAAAPPISGVELVTLLFVLCFTSIPVGVALSYVSALSKDHLLLFVTALIILPTITFAFYPLLFKRVPSPNRRDPYLYLFAIFAWTTIIDLQIAATIDGYTTVLQFYLEEGEKYLFSAYGSLINWWDATIHFTCYILMIYSLSLQTIQHCRNSSLYWAGSILNSLVVFLPGNVTGSWGTELRASYLLNIPFVIVPLYYVKRVLAEDRVKPTPASPPTRSSSSLLSFLDSCARLFFVAFFVLATVVTVIRALCVFKSPVSLAQTWTSKWEPFLLHSHTYPQWQVIVYTFYFIPFFVFALFTLCSSFFSSAALRSFPSGSMADWSVFFAGAFGQAQFSLFPVAMHHLTPEAFTISATRFPDTFHLVVAINVALFVIPQLFALYCVRAFESPSTPFATKKTV